jgi:hypothetical protein
MTRSQTSARASASAPNAITTVSREKSLITSASTVLSSGCRWSSSESISSSFGWCTEATASLTFRPMSWGAAPIATSAHGIRPSLSSIAATRRCRSEPGWPDFLAARSTRVLILVDPTCRDPRLAMPVWRRTAARPAATVMS